MKYTSSHEWIFLEGKVGVVGITKHAQKELGEIVYLQLPKIGARVKAGEEVCVLESTKAAADIYSPVSGKIVAIHEDLLLHPQKIYTFSEKEGWLFKIELENLKEYDALLSLLDYEKLQH